jgi:aconitate hydratase 2 / 2-methylisocitrate dehydratase
VPCSCSRAVSLTKQAQVREGATVVSISTRNFPNRLGKNTKVFLASAELAAIASKLGRIPTVAEHHHTWLNLISAPANRRWQCGCVTIVLQCW